MSVFEALQRTPSQQDVEPPLPERVWVINDQSLDAQEIGRDDWGDFQSRGYRLAPFGSSPIAFGQPVPPATDDPADLWPLPMIERAGGSQIGIWLTKLHAARKAKDEAVFTLTQRIGRKPIRINSQGQQRDLPASPQYAVDVAQEAFLAEAVVALAADVDNLKAEVAALKQAAGKG